MIGPLTDEGDAEVKKKSLPFSATFDHRHENKSCWECPKDQHKHLTYDI